MNEDYICKKDARRAGVIEKGQPITKQNIELVERALDDGYDEVALIMGNAGASDDKGYVMTAGEKIELADYTLQNRGINPNRYMIIPVEEDEDSNTQWASEVFMMSPRINTIYTRNFAIASTFERFKRQYGHDIKTIDKENSSIDYYEILSDHLRGDRTSLSKLKTHIDESTLEWMENRDVFSRVNTIYNRVPLKLNENRKPEERILFLGGLQPFSGNFEYSTGHIGAVREGLNRKVKNGKSQVVIAVASAADSHTKEDPFEVGKRIEMINYTLTNNGVPSDNFYIVPIKNIESNAKFAAKVIAFCPEFDSCLAGDNDWTEELFGEGNYKTRMIGRGGSHTTGESISGTGIRNAIFEEIKKEHNCSKELSEDTKNNIEERLIDEGLMDFYTLEMFRELKGYERMAFLAFGKD